MFYSLLCARSPAYLPQGLALRYLLNEEILSLQMMSSLLAQRVKSIKF